MSNSEDFNKYKEVFPSQRGKMLVESESVLRVNIVRSWIEGRRRKKDGRGEG